MALVGRAMVHMYKPVAHLPRAAGLWLGRMLVAES